jgi:hypothetical protein
VSYRRPIVLAVLILVLIASSAATAQTLPANSEAVPPSVRAQRDAYWDKEKADELALLEGAPVASCGGDYDMAWEPSDISIHVSNRVILTATVTGSQTLLSASKRSRYVETTMHVDQIFQDLSASSHLLPHRDVNLLDYAQLGAIPSAEGSSLERSNCDDALKVGHKYLLVLSYFEKGDFYEQYDSWDISDGIVRANDFRNRYLTAEGHSALNGLPSSQLDPVLHKLLYGTN